ncbi:MAG TPA: nuclear transport factor 2 family protein [Candidatus Angelobacter sp.]|nr:nuclear transport factor 2 family protein [Candidatus Angelobacter sp.]
MEAITAEQVRSQVRDFWDAFITRSKSRFQEFYSPTASCFAADGRRSEPARLMWVRREREFFGPKSSVAAKVGAVTVQLLGPNLGVACYPFHFSIIRVLPNGNRVQVEVPFSRATQVFQRGSDGKMVIIHEHLSSAEPTTPKELPPEPGG